MFDSTRTAIRNALTAWVSIGVVCGSIACSAPPENEPLDGDASDSEMLTDARDVDASQRESDAIDARDVARDTSPDAPRDVHVDAQPDHHADATADSTDAVDARVADSGIVDAGFGLQRRGARFVRIRTIDTEQGSGWALKRPYGYDAQQALALVDPLHPAVLERYISGRVRTDMPVPVATGAAPMTALDFLDASESDEACNRVITPRVSCNEFDNGTLYDTTQALLDMPIGPHPMRYLSLDNWVGFVQSHTRAQAEEMFHRLYAQGWEEVGINDCGFGSGGTVDQLNGFGLATFAEACVDTTTWQPNSDVAPLRRSSNIRLVLLYIDFPGQMAALKALSPDRQADVLTSLAAHQATDGYTFVYQIVQEIPSDVIWDSTQIMTSATGPYHGASIYEVQHQLMDRYNPVTLCP